jgi:hypothetical protein
VGRRDGGGHPSPSLLPCSYGILGGGMVAWLKLRNPSDSSKVARIILLDHLELLRSRFYFEMKYERFPFFLKKKKMTLVYLIFFFKNKK